MLRRRGASAGSGAGDGPAGGRAPGAAVKAKLEELEAKRCRVLAALVRLRACRVFNAFIRLWALTQCLTLCVNGADTRWQGLTTW